MWTWAQLCGREGTGSPSPPFLRKTPEGRPGTRSYEGRCSRHEGQREEHQVWCVLTPASERGAWYGQAHVPGNWLCHAVWWEPGLVLIQSPGKKRWPWRQQWTGGGFAGAVLLGCQSGAPGLPEQARGLGPSGRLSQGTANRGRRDRQFLLTALEAGSLRARCCGGVSPWLADSRPPGVLPAWGGSAGLPSSPVTGRALIRVAS